MLRKDVRGYCAWRVAMSIQKPNPKSIVLVDEHQRDVATNMLSKYNMEGLLVHDPIIAMSELCLMHQLMLQDTAWKDCKPALTCVLIHVERTEQIEQFIQAMQKYLPHVSILELREGQLTPIEHVDHVVDQLDVPVVETEAIDADELSMLLDGTRKQEGDDS